MKRIGMVVHLILVSALCLAVASTLMIGPPAAPPPVLSADNDPETVAPAQEEATWERIFHEPFDTFPGDGWSVEGDADGADMMWGSTTALSAETNPDSVASAWVASGGADGLDAASGNYPNNLQTRMDYGPLDLSSVKGARVNFSLRYDIEGPTRQNTPPPEDDAPPPEDDALTTLTNTSEEGGSNQALAASEEETSGDWLGFCILDSTTHATYDVYNDPDHKCEWYQGYSEESWYEREYSLHDQIGQDDIYLTWVFISDETNHKPNEGAFVDEIEVWTTGSEEQKDPTKDGFNEWDMVYEQSFDDVDFAADPNWTRIEETGTTQWDTVTDWNDSDVKPESAAAAAPAPIGSGYPADLYTWLIYGPIDLSNYNAASVEFSTLYNLVVSDSISESDWGGFCIGDSNDPQDFHDENCEWWSGDSGDTWEQTHYDANPFAGMSEVYLGWALESNVGSSTKAGLLIDEIHVKADPTTGEQAEEIDYDSDGLLLQNSSFDDGLDHWSYKNLSNTESGSVNVTNGIAQLSDNVYLYQPFTVNETVSDLTVSFDHTFTTNETIASNDFFCLSITPADDLSNWLVDLGCWDATVAPTSARDGKHFHKVDLSLDDTELASIQGQSVVLVAEQAQDVQQNGTGSTSVALDNITLYATTNIIGDDGRRHAAQSRDPQEPNDDFDNATTIRCGETLSGVFGDVGGGHDDDMFKIARVPVGTLVVDVDARTLQPPSKADTYLQLYDETGLEPIAENDDDGKTIDSRLSYDVTTSDQTYYVLLHSIREPGPEQFYNLTVRCSDSQGTTETKATTNDGTGDQTTRKAWTMMLYLNAEDQTDDWTEWHDETRAAIEGFIAEKQDFLNVVILMDGPNHNDVIRYLVQPDGAYTDNVNRWQMDEINMGDPDTLSGFVTWSMARYPADNYYLAIDDHGHGVIGISADYHDGTNEDAELDYMTTSELRSALKEATNNGKRKIDIIDYTACLMGLVENAYDTKDYANYLAFYQSIAWTSSKYSEALADIQATDSVLTVAKRLVEREPVTDTDTPYTYTLVDTSKMEDLRRKIDSFAVALRSADLAEVEAARNESQAFNGQLEKGNASQDTLGYIDLWDFADNVANRGIAVNEATALKTAIKSVIVTQKTVARGQSSYTEEHLWDYSNAHGLSILYPLYSYTLLDNYQKDYQMSLDGKWDEFLQVAVQNVGGTTTQGTTIQGYPKGKSNVIFGLEAKRLLEGSTEDMPDDDEPTDTIITIYLPVVLGQ